MHPRVRQIPPGSSLSITATLRFGSLWSIASTMCIADLSLLKLGHILSWQVHIFHLMISMIILHLDNCELQCKKRPDFLKVACARFKSMSSYPLSLDKSCSICNF